MKKIISFLFAASLFASASYGQLKIGTDGHVGIGSYAPSSSYNLHLGSANFKSTARFDGAAQFYQPATFSSSATFTSTLVTFNRFKVNSYVGIGKDPLYPYSIDIGNGKLRIYNQSYNNNLILDYQGGYYSASMYPSNNNTCNVGLSNKAFKYVYAYNYPSVSDRRQKENIRDIQNALSIVLKMRGVLYDLKKEYAYNDDMIKGPGDEERLENERKDIYGFIAQELEEAAPEVILYDDSTDVYTINYQQVIPLLAEAIKDLNEMIIKLDEKSNAEDEKSADDPTIESNTDAMLGKNRPNPFNENTTIEYYLPSAVQKANLYVYDLQGKQIKSMPVNEREYGQVTLYGSELQPGIYHYSLIADGQLIGIEKMVLTD